MERMDVRLNWAGGQIPSTAYYTTMLVDYSNYATLVSIVWELALIRMSWADQAHTQSTKLATPDHRLVYSLSILDAPARCSYQRLVIYP